MQRLFASLALVAVLACPAPVKAWGSSGHRMLGAAVAQALPSELPAFLRTPAAARDLGELSREPDRSKGAGRMHSSDRDPAHFIDYGDAGDVLGGPPMLPLAATRQAYETQLRAAGLDQWKAGYLPYAIIDRYQQLTSDFAYWRVLKAAEENPKWKAHRAFFTQDRIRREALVLRSLGELSHFVSDGSQPLHVSTHFNGWGPYPNPNAYSTAPVHGPFEGEFVAANIGVADVSKALPPFRSCRCPIEQRVGEYLSRTGSFVVPFYELEKAGGFAPGDPRGVAFARERMTAGAAEIRDLTLEAWRASATRMIGWKPIPVADVLAGTLDPYPALYGSID